MALTRTYEWTDSLGVAQQRTVRPKPPFDAARYVGAFVSTLPIAATLASLSWTTICIGETLTAALPAWAAPIAYVVAALFDLTWVWAMAKEWQLRFQPARRAKFVIAGVGFLLVSVLATFFHGYQVQGWILATIGAAVAVLAKLVWTLEVASNVPKLSEQAQFAINHEQEIAAIARATAAQSRDLIRMRAKTDAMLEAYGLAPLFVTAERGPSTGEHPSEQPEHGARPAPSTDEQPASTPITTGHEQAEHPRAVLASMDEQARALLAGGATKEAAIAQMLADRPDANPESVKAAVRRQVRKQ